MKEIWNVIQVIFAVIGGSIDWFLGGCDGFLYINHMVHFNS